MEEDEEEEEEESGKGRWGERKSSLCQKMQVVEYDWYDGSEEFTGGLAENEPGKVGR